MTAPASPKPNVLILGGTGVFGSRLARMLLQDGWPVTVTSRNLKRAEEFAKQYGGAALAWDRAQPLMPLLTGFQIVVDAAGPFQTYGADPYTIANQVIAAGCHYLDLSDDGAFTAGITVLDQAARRNAVTALSGVSSVPALSSAAVTALAEGWSRTPHIEAAILPGNRAPRGYSVMQSILGQIGAPLNIWRDGRWQQRRGWSGSKIYQLAPDLQRKAALIGAPDLQLFPDYFNADTVEFRAGLELAWMQTALSLASPLRQAGILPDLARFTRLFQRVAGWFENAGTDRGGMVVEIGDGAQRRRWTLLAEAGDGPFIPAIPALIACRKLATGNYTPGARPALDIFTLQEAEAALSRLQVRCSRCAS